MMTPTYAKLGKSTEKTSFEGRPLIHSWDAPQGKVGLAQPWVHSIDFRIQQAPSSNPDFTTDRDVLEKTA